MEYVLRLVGAIAIVIGVFVAGTGIANLLRAGVPLQGAFLVPAVTGSIGIILIGIVLLGFGAIVALLRRIKENTDH